MTAAVLADEGSAQRIRTLKESYVRNCFGGSLRSDVGRRASCVAPQPELGILPERRTGLGFSYSGGPALDGQNLNGM
jgi:hypothetical protein